MTLKAVFFDVGETLIDESRMWRGWAAYLGVPAQEFLAALEDVIASGADHRRVFDRFRANFDIAAARAHRIRRQRHVRSGGSLRVRRACTSVPRVEKAPRCYAPFAILWT